MSNVKVYQCPCQACSCDSICPNTKTKNLMEICYNISIHFHCEFNGLKTLFGDFFFNILSVFKLKTQLEREGDLRLKRGQYRILAVSRRLRVSATH